MSRNDVSSPEDSKWKGQSCPRCVSPLEWRVLYLGRAQAAYVFVCTEEDCGWDESQEKDFDRKRIVSE